MSAVREGTLAHRVLVILHALPDRKMTALALVTALNVKKLTPNKLESRCWQIISLNLVFLNGTNWVLMSAGAAVVKGHPVAPVGLPAPAIAAVSRSIQNGVTSAKPLSMAGIYANVRAEGLTFKTEPSLMGLTRKLPSGEVIG